MPCFPFFRRSDEIQRDVLIFGLTDAYAYFDDLRCVSFCTTLYRALPVIGLRRSKTNRVHDNKQRSTTSNTARLAQFGKTSDEAAQHGILLEQFTDRGAFGVDAEVRVFRRHLDCRVAKHRLDEQWVHPLFLRPRAEKVPQ